MDDCFISYRRKPSSSQAVLIQEKLKNRHSLNAYVDTTRTDGTTVQFPERLMQAIEDAPVFVCLLGYQDDEHTLESEWVLKEIAHAHSLHKFCVPVFQESYQPIISPSEAVDYLLSFDGVHVFDQKNVFVDEAIDKIANLVRPHRLKQSNLQLHLRTLLFGLIVIALTATIVLAGSTTLNPKISSFEILSEESEARVTIDYLFFDVPQTISATTSQVSGKFSIDFANPSETTIDEIRAETSTLTTGTLPVDDEILGSIVGEDPVVFSPLRYSSLPSTAIDVGDELRFEVTGNLNIGGFTNVTTVSVETLLVDDNRIEGTASTTVKYSDFGLEIPPIPGIEPGDEVLLEFIFVAVRGSDTFTTVS